MQNAIRNNRNAIYFRTIQRLQHFPKLGIHMRVDMRDRSRIIKIFSSQT